MAAARVGVVLYHGGRQLVTGARRAESLVCGVGPLDTLPGRMIGAKPAAVCRWIFTLLGVAPGDRLDDLFPGSGAFGRAWAAYTGCEPSLPAASDASCPDPGDASSPGCGHRLGPVVFAGVRRVVQGPGVRVVPSCDRRLGPVV